LTIAGALLGTDDISMHGIFNARPQLPDHRETQTPWHQDAQYWDLDYGDERDRERATHVVTLWLPLQPVDERSDALAVASLRDTKGALYPHEPSDFERTGFLKIPDAVMAALPVDAPRIGPGDALVFTQITPHGAWPNHADHIRWSVDIRYEATATATVVGRKYGFVAQDRSDPSRETSLDDWLAKRRPPSPEAPRPLAEVAPERGR
jgi:ectoine hydroxylase-related dioxygenase (phytanoyl-CoA dioxygenase family)